MITGGLAVGGTVGWWIGSLAACVDAGVQCSVSVDAVAALGTWVGGLGTVAAVMFAAASFRRERQMERDEREEASLRATDHAQRVSVSVSVTDYDEVEIRQIAAVVQNPEGEYALTDVRVAIPSAKAVLSTPFLRPGERTTLSWEFEPPLGREFGSGAEEVAGRLEGDAVLSFQIAGLPWSSDANGGSVPVRTS